ncbi:MAG: pyruvate flavodoxin/ferredoxin oxidoreductase [Planctomycetes bacterium]|nr:pyruvate flavodoxin/ferredoxin oxidoreductase [Planctomycetota bacterium]
MREFIDGSTAIVRGALDAGCTFFAGYPITPASPILMHILRELPKVGGVAIQAEDEIASIGMCIGATLSGSRAMTATSGPGLSLYSENIGLAIMGEVPLVIVDVQRLGPATGGATTVGQGDVQFVRWGTGGGYPVIALAPSTVAECYSLTRRAFDLAERFRCPVFLLTDKELDMTSVTVETESYERPPVRARAVLAAPVARAAPVAGAAPVASATRGANAAPAVIANPPPYRYEPADGVSPLAQYGGDVLVRFTGSTHDERALITKAPSKVAALNEHLRAKIEQHADEIELVELDQDSGARTLLVSYGVTAGAMHEAVARLRAAGRAVSALVVKSLWPVPERALRTALLDVDRVVVGELNHGQYRREVERLAPGLEVRGVNRVDGELITPEQFMEAAR